MATVELSQVRAWYDERGDGEPLVLLHGGAVDARFFDPNIDALVLGRVTYEGFAAAWPTMTHEGDFAVRMNTMPKHVASRTLTTTTWNAELLPNNPVATVAELKQASGGDLLLYGSPTFADALTAAGLVDEYRIMLFPTVVGSGARLFAGVSDTAFGLEGVVTTSPGVAVLTYLRSDAS